VARLNDVGILACARRICVPQPLFSNFELALRRDLRNEAFAWSKAACAFSIAMRKSRGSMRTRLACVYAHIVVHKHFRGVARYPWADGGDFPRLKHRR
jgi:hypothetical protein